MLNNSASPKEENHAVRYRTPGNLVYDIHTFLWNIPVVFREMVCRECNWSIPTFYRKMRLLQNKDKDGKPFKCAAISNAEKKMIIKVFGDIHSLINENYMRRRQNA